MYKIVFVPLGIPLVSANAFCDLFVNIRSVSCAYTALHFSLQSFTSL